MSSDYREGYSIGFEAGKKAGKEEYKKELTDSLQNAMPTKAIIPYEVPSLRDQFAMSAMHGIVSTDKLVMKEIADIAYDIADAMLKERNKRC